MSLLIGHGSVFDAVRDDEKFAFLQPNIPVSKLHPKPALDDEEQLVFIIVVVPNEWPLELHELDQLAAEFTDDLRLPVLGKQRKFFREVHLVHYSIIATLLY